MVLDAAELAIIRDRVNAINASVREIAAAGGVPVLDLNAFITDLLTLRSLTAAGQRRDSCPTRRVGGRRSNAR